MEEGCGDSDVASGNSTVIQYTMFTVNTHYLYINQADLGISPQTNIVLSLVVNKVIS